MKFTQNLDSSVKLPPFVSILHLKLAPTFQFPLKTHSIPGRAGSSICRTAWPPGKCGQVFWTIYVIPDDRGDCECQVSNWLAVGRLKNLTIIVAAFVSLKSLTVNVATSRLFRFKFLRG